MNIFKQEPASVDCSYPNIQQALPPSKLGYHSNNKYDNFPPLMADGRAVIASYQPEAVLNNYLLKETGVESNWQYRQYLTKNAKEVMKYNCVQAANDAGYFHRYTDLVSSSHSTPYLYPSMTSTAKPAGYQQSDLKELYLSREQLQSVMVAPELTQSELYKVRSQN